MVGRSGGDEEPRSKCTQSFSKFSLLLYTEKIIVQNNYYVFLPHANSVPSLAKVENKTKSNLDWSTVDSCPADTSLLQTSCFHGQEPVPEEMYKEMTERNFPH